MENDKQVLELNIPQGSLIPNIEKINNKAETWYKDKGLKTPFNFKNPVYADITIYGKSKEQNSKKRNIIIACNKSSRNIFSTTFKIFLNDKKQQRSTIKGKEKLHKKIL